MELFFCTHRESWLKSQVEGSDGLVWRFLSLPRKHCVTSSVTISCHVLSWNVFFLTCRRLVLSVLLWSCVVLCCGSMS